MPHRLELRDLRSLERPGLRRLFHPLDPAERLPRELMLESRRWRLRDHRKLVTAVGAGYLPGLMLVVVLLTSAGSNPLLAFAAAGVLLLAVYVFAVRMPSR